MPALPRLGDSHVSRQPGRRLHPARCGARRLGRPSRMPPPGSAADVSTGGKAVHRGQAVAYREAVVCEHHPHRNGMTGRRTPRPWHGRGVHEGQSAVLSLQCPSRPSMPLIGPRGRSQDISVKWSLRSWRSRSRRVQTRVGGDPADHGLGGDAREAADSAGVMSSGLARSAAAGSSAAITACRGACACPAAKVASACPPRPA